MTYPEGSDAGNGGLSLNGIIFLSFIVHILLLSFLVFSAPLLPMPKLTFGPVYSVQLVNMPAGLPEKRGEELAARDILGQIPARQSVLGKASLDPLPVPVTSPDARRKSIDSVEKAVEAIRKNMAPTVEKPLSSAKPPLTSRIMSQASSPAAQTSEGDLQAGMRNYYGVIWSRIKGLWTIPQGLLPTENIEAVVHVRILRDGSMTNVGLEKRSGNRYFDDAALRSVKKANPLPPLPDELRDSSIEIGIRFHSSEFK